MIVTNIMQKSNRNLTKCYLNARNILFDKIKINIIQGTSIIKSNRLIHTTKQNEFLFRTGKHHIKSHNYLTDHHVVNGVYTEMGSIQPVPKWYKLGIIKVLFIVATFIGIGSFISQQAVSILEDYEIYVPEDDD